MKKSIVLALFCTLISASFANELPASSTATVAAPSAIKLLQETAPTDSINWTGSELIQDCILRFPTEEMQLVGRLTMRRRYGIEMLEYDFNANICWGTPEPYATYKFYSLKGELLDNVTIKRTKNGEITLSRDMKTPLGAQIPPPKMHERVLGSDVTWIDATMDFLWWESPELIGEGEVKGRDCDIIKLIPPATSNSDCAFGKVWLDKAQRVLMQATQNDEAGKELRRLWVRAVQKLEVAEGDERWVIKDLEVETTGSGHRTRLHFDDVKIVH